MLILYNISGITLHPSYQIRFKFALEIGSNMSPVGDLKKY